MNRKLTQVDNKSKGHDSDKMIRRNGSQKDRVIVKNDSKNTQNYIKSPSSMNSQNSHTDKSVRPQSQDKNIRKENNRAGLRLPTNIDPVLKNPQLSQKNSNRMEEVFSSTWNCFNSFYADRENNQKNLEFSNKPQDQVKRQKHVSSCWLNKDTKADRAEYSKSPKPNLKINSDKPFKEDQLRNNQNPASAVQVSNLSNIISPKNDNKEKISKKPSGYKLKERKYNYFNKYPDKIEYQSQKQDFESGHNQNNNILPVNDINMIDYLSQANLSSIVNSSKKQIYKNISAEKSDLKKQDKASESYEIQDKLINSAFPSNKKNELIKNSVERYQIISAEEEKNDKKLAQAYNAANNCKRLDDPNSGRIMPIPESRSYANCNIGLPCIGNACYMNSVLQILANTEGFYGIISSIKLPIFSSLSSILQLMKNKSEHNLSSAISQFKNTLGSEFSMFQGWNQNDPKNLFQIIISKLSEQKPAFNLFLIRIEKSLVCRRHEAITINENRSIFMVDTSKIRNIQSYIDGLKSPESFKGANALYCDRCGCLRDIIVETKRIETSANLAFYLFPAVAFIPSGHIYIENNNYVLYGVICYNASGCYSAFTYCESQSSWVEYSCSKVAFVEQPDFRYVYMLFYKNKF